MSDTINNYSTTGEEVYRWNTHDYHPHKRGLLWYIVFVIIFGGTSLWSLLADHQWGWIGSFSILMVAAIYFWIHRKGNEDHKISIFERGILIDQRAYFPWEKFEGFWFVYDETVSIINFEYKGDKGRKITLQLGELTPNELRNKLTEISLEELAEKKESLLDLWIRALKL